MRFAPFRYRTVSLLPLAVLVGCSEGTAPVVLHPSIESDSLPRALTGVSYAAPLLAIGGTPPHTWTLAAGALPAGLTLSTQGSITGTPTTPGIASFAIRVTGADGGNATREASIQVLRQLSPAESCADHPEAIAAFADPSLEYAVRGILGAAMGQGYDAFAGDLACHLLPVVYNLFHVTNHPEGIQNLEGAQNLTRLDYLLLPDRAFRDNRISDLSPLAALTSLRVLSLSENEIADLSPLAGLSGLRDLFIDNNRVSDLSPLIGMSGLEQLSVGRGGYIPLDISWPEPKGEPITDLEPLRGLVSLKQLWIYGQAITQLDALADLTALEDLNAYNNAISDVRGLANNRTLEWIRLSDNLISDVSPLSGLDSVFALSLDRNSIVRAALSDLPKLTWLDLSYNLLMEVGPWTGLPSLRYLLLRGNSTILDFAPLAGLSATVLQLDLSETGISDLTPLAGLIGLRELALANNGLADISALRGLSSLHYLYLDGNAALADIQPLLDNPGIGPRELGYSDSDRIDLRGTSVSCADVNALRAKGPIVQADCP